MDLLASYADDTSDNQTLDVNEKVSSYTEHFFDVLYSLSLLTPQNISLNFSILEYLGDFFFFGVITSRLFVGGNASLLIKRSRIHSVKSSVFCLLGSLLFKKKTVF